MRKIYGYFCDNGKFHLTKELQTKFGVVPLPFKSDGFSIPWFLRWFHNPFGIGLVAAIWHDYALKKKLKKAQWQFLELLLDQDSASVDSDQDSEAISDTDSDPLAPQIPF